MLPRFKFADRTSVSRTNRYPKIIKNSLKTPSPQKMPKINRNGLSTMASKFSENNRFSPLWDLDDESISDSEIDEIDSEEYEAKKRDASNETKDLFGM